MVSRQKKHESYKSKRELRKLHGARDFSKPETRKLMFERFDREHWHDVSLAKEEILEVEDRIKELKNKLNRIIEKLPESQSEEVPGTLLKNGKNIAEEAMMLFRKKKTAIAGLDTLERDYHETLRIEKLKANKKAEESFVHRFKSEEPRSAALALTGALSTASFFIFNNFFGTTAIAGGGVAAALGPIGLPLIAAVTSILVGVVAYNVIRRVYRNYKSKHWIPHKKAIKFERREKTAQEIEKRWQRQSKKEQDIGDIRLRFIVKGIKNGRKYNKPEAFKKLLINAKQIKIEEQSQSGKAARQPSSPATLKRPDRRRSTSARSLRSQQVR